MFIIDNSQKLYMHESIKQEISENYLIGRLKLERSKKSDLCFHGILTYQP